LIALFIVTKAPIEKKPQIVKKIHVKTNIAMCFPLLGISCTVLPLS
jgi:hypothetical protein